VLPAAQSHIAGERKRSRWSKARLSLVVPIGAIVGGLGGALLFGMLAFRDTDIAVAREPVRRGDR